MKLTRFQKRKAARLKWSRNANAAKARKRMESEPSREPRYMPQAFGWEITVKNLLDGKKDTFRPSSGRHAKRVLDALFSNYQP